MHNKNGLCISQRPFSFLFVAAEDLVQEAALLRYGLDAAAGAFQFGDVDAADHDLALLLQRKLFKHVGVAHQSHDLRTDLCLHDRDLHPPRVERCLVDRDLRKAGF